MTAASVKAARKATRPALTAVRASVDPQAFERLDGRLRRLVGGLDVLTSLYCNQIDVLPDPANLCELFGMLRDQAEGAREDLEDLNAKNGTGPGKAAA